MLFAALALVPRIGTEFLPQLDEGAIAINVVRLPSASLEGSVAVGLEIERRLLAKFPEVETVVTKTGRAEISEDPMGRSRMTSLSRCTRRRSGKPAEARMNSWPRSRRN